MITTLQIGNTIINGDPFVLSEVRGLASAYLENTSYSRPDMRGMNHIRSMYRQRHVSFTGYITGTSESNYATNRDTFFSAFTDTDILNTVKISMTDGKNLQFRAYLANPVEADLLFGQTTVGAYTLEMEAPDPALYSQTLHSSSVGVASGEILVNTGNIKTYPTYKVYGPGGTFTFGTPSGEMVVDMWVADGDYVQVDTDARTVLYNGTTNAYYAFSGDWEPLYAGNNNFTLSVASGEDVNTRVLVDWRDAYIGV